MNPLLREARLLVERHGVGHKAGREEVTAGISEALREGFISPASFARQVADSIGGEL